MRRIKVHSLEVSLLALAVVLAPVPAAASELTDYLACGVAVAATIPGGGLPIIAAIAICANALFEHWAD